MAPGIDLSTLHTTDTTSAQTAFLKKQLPANITPVFTTPDNQIQAISLSNPLVLDPASITTDFDLHRFHAAAFSQLPKVALPDTTTKDQPTILSTDLISSPYNVPGHYLDLSSLSPPSLFFALALTALQPTSPDYATAPYASALNFPRVITLLRSLLPPGYTWPTTSFYVVVFRSVLKPNIDSDLLYTLDFESHREACESGGLLKYWFGKADEERRNLATCEFSSFLYYACDSQADSVSVSVDERLICMCTRFLAFEAGCVPRRAWALA
jgi:hypothetical protein